MVRVAGYDTVMPLPRLEEHYIPSVERIVAGARRVLEAHGAELVKVPVGDPGVVRDIDRPADLAPPLAV